MKIAVLSEARTEAVDAAGWYDQRRSGLGDEFLEAVQNILDRIAKNPESFPLWEFASGSVKYRRGLLHRFPFAIVFVVRTDEVVVVAVSHGRRHHSHWIDRLH